MSPVVHYELELDTVLSQPLCENQRGCDAIADIGEPVEMSPFDDEVTCAACLEALGYAIPAEEQLTEVHGDPFLNRRAA